MLGAADCGRLSICYSRRRGDTQGQFAADCGRLSICYSQRVEVVTEMPGCGLRPSLDLLLYRCIPAWPRLRCGLRPSLDLLLSCDVNLKSTPLLRIAAVSRFATLYRNEVGAVHALRIAAVSRFATLGLSVHAAQAGLRIAAVSRFATLISAEYARLNRLRIAAVSRFATLPFRQAIEIAHTFALPCFKKAEAGRAIVLLVAVFSRHRP